MRTAAALAATLVSAGATDTFYTAFLTFDYVRNGATQDGDHHESGNDINQHIYTTFLDYFLLYALRAFVLERMPRMITTAIMATTAIKPGTKPTPTLESAIKVPI